MRKASARSVLMLVCLMLGLTATISAFDFSKMENAVTEHTLKNGLKVLVMERHDAPVASFVTYANVGATDDPKGFSGLAHMLEHMAFKGTKSLGSKDIDNELKLMAVEDSIFTELRAERNKGRFADTLKIQELTAAYDTARDAAYELVEPNKFGNVVEREGGVGLNAYTSMDETVYFFSLPSNKVELWMAMESDRFLNPVLREMYKERDVVAEERRMRTESSPIGKLIEEFLCLSFKAHPYGIPTIGHMSDIQCYSRKEVMDYFNKHYVPSNMVIAIVGDVKTKDVIKLAEKYWGPIPYRPAPERIATIEPEQHGERRMTIEDPSQPFYIAGWHVPNNTHPDRPALDALCDYLGQGRTSLLYKNLIKEKKAAMNIGAFAGFPGGKYPTMMAVYAMPAAEHNNEEMEIEIFAEIEKLRTELISSEDVEKIKARAKAGFINQLDNNNGIALQLAAYQTQWGNWREMFRELDRINKVTADDIQRVANEYLTEKNRNVAMITTEEN